MDARLITKIPVELPNRDSTAEVTDVYFQKDTGTLITLTRIHEKISKERSAACKKEVAIAFNCPRGLIKAKRDIVVKTDAELELARESLPIECRFYHNNQYVKHEFIKSMTIGPIMTAIDAPRDTIAKQTPEAAPSFIKRCTGLNPNTFFAVAAVTSVAVAGAAMAVTNIMTNKR